MGSNTINRREFLKRGSLGSLGLLVTTQLWGQVLKTSDAPAEIVAYAVDYAHSQGFTYADARLGPCELNGAASTQRLGLRLANGRSFRALVLDQWTRADIREAIRHCHQAPDANPSPSPVAIFDEEEVLATAETHDEVQAQAGDPWLRFAPPALTPKDGSFYSYVSILLDQ